LQLNDWACEAIEHIFRMGRAQRNPSILICVVMGFAKTLDPPYAKHVVWS